SSDLLEVRDDEEGHEGKGHERRPQRGAEGFGEAVDSDIGLGNFVAFGQAHEAGNRKRQDHFGGGGGRGSGAGVWGAQGALGGGSVRGGGGCGIRAARVHAGEAPMMRDHEVDGAANAFVVAADGHDVMTVMRNRRGEGAAAEAKAADERFRDGTPGMVAVDDDDLQDIRSRVGVEAAVCGETVGDPDDGLVGDQLAVERLDDIDLFHIFLLTPFVEVIPEVTGGMVVGVKVVNGVCDAGGRRDGGLAVLEDDLAADDRPEHFEVDEVGDHDEVGGMTGAEQPGLKPVVDHGIHASCAQDLEQVHSRGYGPGAKAVDMAAKEIVGVAVIGAEHHAVRMVVQQADERVEIAGGAAFADDDLHPGLQLFQRLIGGCTLVVRRHPRMDIFQDGLAAKAGSVAVDGLPDPLRGVDLGHYLGVLAEHTGEIHHFTQVPDVVARQELGDFRGLEGGPGRFEPGGGDAAWRPEIEVEGDGIAVADHEFHSRKAGDVGDLVRIADRRDGPMCNRQAGELRGYEKGRLDMDVGIDETGEDIGRIVGKQDGCGFRGFGGGVVAERRDGLDPTRFYRYNGRVDAALEDVDKLADELH